MPLPDIACREGCVIIKGMRKEKFVTEEYYHIYNRTIANYSVFNNEGNAKRLLQAFLFANSTKSSEAFQVLRNNKESSVKESLEIIKRGEKLVDLLCYAIMPDHYHLLIKERKENGIINFVHKCDISISKYINIKNDRKGPLFESRFKSKHVDINDYLVHLSAYIHLNPLDIITGKEWREHKLDNWSKIRKPLLNFPWSSLKLFFGEKAGNHLDSILSGCEIITNQFKSSHEYELRLKRWATNSNTELNNLSEDNFD